MRAAVMSTDGSRVLRAHGGAPGADASQLGRDLAAEVAMVGRDVVVALGVGEYARLHQQRLETDEHLARHDLKAALCVVGGVDRIHRVTQRLDKSEPKFGS